MPLEDLTGTDKYLDAFNKDWPLDDDERPEGDDHIRGIKNVLINTFGALSAYYDLARAVLWNVPASGQPQTTGSLRVAVGTTAQRPAAPTTGDERWNTDVRPEGWQPEQYYQGGWKHRIMCVDLENFIERSQYIDSRADTVPSGNEYGVFWGPSYDNAARMASIRGRSIDDAAGTGQFRMGLRLANVFNDCVVIDRTDGFAVFNMPKFTVNGLEPVYQGSVAYEATPVDFSLGQHVFFTHGMSVRPKLYKAYLWSKEFDAGYGAGTEVEFGTVCGTNDTTNNNESTMSSLYIDDDTNIKLRISSRHVAVAGNGGAYTQINPTKWQVFVRAWA